MASSGISSSPAAAATPFAPIIHSSVAQHPTLLSSYTRQLLFLDDEKMIGIAWTGEDITVWDVNDPAAPRKQFSDNSPGSTISALLLDDNKILWTQQGGLWRGYDTQKFEAGALVTQDLFLGGVTHTAECRNWQATADGNYLWGSDGNGSVVGCLDVTDPRAPVDLSSISGPRANQVGIADNGTLVVPDNVTGKVFLYDISNPASPTEVGQTAVLQTSSLFAAICEGNYAYIIGTNRVYVLDVSDPTTPTTVGSLTTGWTASSAFWASNVVKHGKWIYAANDSNKVVRVDVSTPATPVVGPDIVLQHKVSQFTIHRNMLWVCGTDTSANGLSVIGAAPPAGTTSVEETTTARTLKLTDAQRVVECTNAAATTVTVPPNSSVAYPVGTVVSVYAAGAGGVTIAQGAGVTIRNLAALTQYEETSLRKRATDEWVQA